MSGLALCPIVSEGPICCEAAYATYLLQQGSFVKTWQNYSNLHVANIITPWLVILARTQLSMQVNGEELASARWFGQSVYVEKEEYQCVKSTSGPVLWRPMC